MKKFNVLIWDFNQDKSVPYDVIPYFIRMYKERNAKLKTHKEFKEFILRWGQYQFWARCEYEMQIMGWPQQKRIEKIDVFKQIEMNADIVAEILRKNVRS